MTPGRGRSTAVEAGLDALRALSLLVQLGVVASYNGLHAQCPDGSPPPCRAQPGRAAPTPASNSVAVLYFDNLSRDTADAYLAEGLTDEIIARLGQIERLNVKSRTAVSRHRGAGTDPMVLSRALGVAYVVNGTVRRGKDRLRVTVELLQAASGDRLWGQQYDRAQADFLAIQEDIAVSVASAADRLPTITSSKGTTTWASEPREQSRGRSRSTRLRGRRIRRSLKRLRGSPTRMRYFPTGDGHSPGCRPRAYSRAGSAPQMARSARTPLLQTLGWHGRTSWLSATRKR